jgi:hypothetical protein
MKYASAAAVMVAALLLGQPLVASADVSSYTQRLQEEIPYVVQKYGEQALVNEGYKVCSWKAQGVPDIGGSGSVVDRIMADLPMSSSAAAWVQILAEDELGC